MVQPPGQLVIVNVVAWLTVSGSGQYTTRIAKVSAGLRTGLAGVRDLGSLRAVCGVRSDNVGHVDVRSGGIVGGGSNTSEGGDGSNGETHLDVG